MTLYNCKSTRDREVYRITKFTEDLEVESSYLTGPKTCECPGYAKRNTCRHGAIRALFMTSGHIDDEWLLDYDTREWTRNPAVAILNNLLSHGEIIRGAVDISKSPNTIVELEEEGLSAPELAALARPPAGVTVVSLEDPAELHNTIADAVGEALGVGVSATPAPAPAVERKASHSPAAPAGVSPLRKGRKL